MYNEPFVTAGYAYDYAVPEFAGAFVEPYGVEEYAGWGAEEVVFPETAYYGRPVVEVAEPVAVPYPVAVERVVPEIQEYVEPFPLVAERAAAWNEGWNEYAGFNGFEVPFVGERAAMIPEIEVPYPVEHMLDIGDEIISEARWGAAVAPIVETAAVVPEVAAVAHAAGLGYRGSFAPVASRIATERAERNFEGRVERAVATETAIAAADAASSFGNLQSKWSLLGNEIMESLRIPDIKWIN